MNNNCEHEYEVGMVLAGQLNCKKCGLLKSTIESEVKPEGVGEWEKTNRIEMIRLKCDLLYSAGVQGDGKYLVRVKDEIEESISTLLLQEKAKCMADFEKQLEEYRNSPEVWKNVGISKWKAEGERKGYFDYLSKH